MDKNLHQERNDMDRMIQQQRDHMDSMIKQRRDDMDQKLQLKRKEIDIMMREEHSATDKMLKRERAAMVKMLQQERENMDINVRLERQIVDQAIQLERVRLDKKTMEARVQMDLRKIKNSEHVQPQPSMHLDSIPTARPSVVMEFFVHKGLSGSLPSVMTLVEPGKVDWLTMVENLGDHGYKENCELYYLKPGYTPPKGLVLLHCSEHVDRLLHDHKGTKTCHLYILKNYQIPSANDGSSGEQNVWSTVEEDEDSGVSVKRVKMDTTNFD